MIFEDRKTCRRTKVYFRPFQDEDENAFRSCIEDYYGGGYPYKQYLTPGYLSNKCRKSAMSILCGVTEKGDIISTSAVRFDTEFAGSGLLLLRVVRNAYQGMGIGTKQEEILLQSIQGRKGLLSLYADVMAHNTVSQQSLARQGFVLCGVRPMLYRAEVMLPGGAWPKGARLSQAVMCRRERVGDAGVFYCPEEHREVAKQIYDELGVNCRLESKGQSCTVSKTVYSNQHDALHHNSIWVIQEVGEDFASLLEDLNLKTERIFLCYLNLKSSGAANAYRMLRRAGCFFTGLKPMNRSGEYMIMAHVGQRCVRNAEICLYPEGAWLLDYIHKQYE